MIISRSTHVAANDIILFFYMHALFLDPELVRRVGSVCVIYCHLCICTFLYFHKKVNKDSLLP